MRLFNKNFSLVIAGQIVSILGSSILRFALNLYVLDKTGRADIFALVIALSSIPGILCTPIGGAIADRFSKRNLMVIFDFSSSAIVLLLLLLMYTNNASVSAIGVILAALGIISSMYQPTVQASVPVLVGENQLAGANGIVNGVGALSGLLGPVLGGALYQFIGIEILVGVSCAAFFMSAVMEIFIRIPFVKRETRAAIIPMIFGDIKDGFRYTAKNNPVIFRIFALAAALNLFLSPLFIIGVPYILRFTMNSGDLMYGIGLGIIECATIIGALSAGLFTKNLKMPLIYRPLVLIAVLLLPMAAALFPALLAQGYWPPFFLFFFFCLIVLAAVTMVSVFVITEIQKRTPAEMLGKIMAILLAVSQIAAPLGQLLYGICFQAFSRAVYVPVLIAAALTFITAYAGKKILREDAGGK
ncbi:MAG: MFS transporter [Treponema sp.]|jgi:MFS family permease|nr:MFS transporter [Treponema sp.]